MLSVFIETSSSSSDELSYWEKIAIVIAIAVFFLILIIIIVCCIVKRGTRSQEKPRQRKHGGIEMEYVERGDLAFEIDDQNRSRQYKLGKRESYPDRRNGEGEQSDRQYLYVPPDQEVLVNVGIGEQATCRPVLVMEVLHTQIEENKVKHPL